MSDFLLLGVRPRASREVSPAGLARDVAAATAWHRWLRQWGLLRSFALPPEPATEVRACLVVRASGHPAAALLAAGWGRVSGYQVSVAQLRDAAVREKIAS